MLSSDIRHYHVSLCALHEFLSLTIHMGRFELSSGNLLLEEVVEFQESSVFGLCDSEVCVDCAQNTHAEPVPSTFCLPVPSSSGKHSRDHLSVDSVSDNVGGSSQHDRLSSDSRVGSFTNDGVTGWTEGELEGEVDQDHHDCHGDSFLCFGKVGNTDDTDDELPKTDNGNSGEVELSSTNSTHKVNGDTGSNDVGGLNGHRVVESHGLGHTGSSEADMSMKLAVLWYTHKTVA